MTCCWRRQMRWSESILALLVILTCNGPALGQRGGQEPDIGYAYPSGGQIGTEVRVVVGGQTLDDASDLYVSGQGITVSDLEFDKPLSNREVNVIQDKLEKAREKLVADGKTVNVRKREGPEWEELLALLKEVDVTEEDLDKVDEYRSRQNDPKRQLNPQLEQTVTATLTIASDATAGRRELRVRTPRGLSNPLGFFISPFPEFLEVEPNDAAASEAIDGEIPFVLNGQIMPGDVDRFRFQAEKGDKLVFRASARELMPYLADAVPGWFQATIALYDETGREVAYEDDFQFHPDPVLFYRIPKSGNYEVEIKDSIFRGREDFVYRIEVGELPFLKTIFPMGTRVGSPVTVSVDGWNLPVDTVNVDYVTKEVGRFAISVPVRRDRSNELPFDVDDFVEFLDQEPNDEMASAQVVKPPCIVNGRLDFPGDWDLFHFRGRKGFKVMLEVDARRMNSPVDSLLKLTDGEGKQVDINDDFEDKGTGLVTHHADSQLLVTLPSTGSYYVHLGDAQKKGGESYVYRLRISARRPDFDLRVVPSCINARPGSTVPITIFALRRDGFEGDIDVELAAAPEGYKLAGGPIPTEKENAELMLTIPRQTPEGIQAIDIKGRAYVSGKPMERPVVAADDMMQAFIYHHLVPAEKLLVMVSPKAVVRRATGGQGNSSVPLLKIPHGGTAAHPVPVPNRESLDGVFLELTDPPDGLSLLRVTRGESGFMLLLSADANKVKPGFRGSLGVNLYVERVIQGRDGQPNSKRKVPIETLPPIAFEVTRR